MNDGTLFDGFVVVNFGTVSTEPMRQCPIIKSGYFSRWHPLSISVFLGQKTVVAGCKNKAIGKKRAQVFDNTKITIDGNGFDGREIIE